MLEGLALFRAALGWNDQRLKKAQDVPNYEERRALKREASELEEKRSNQESHNKWAGLVPQGHFDAQCLNQREHSYPSSLDKGSLSYGTMTRLCRKCKQTRELPN